MSILLQLGLVYLTQVFKDLKIISIILDNSMTILLHFKCSYKYLEF